MEEERFNNQKEQSTVGMNRRSMLLTTVGAAASVVVGCGAFIYNAAKDGPTVAILSHIPPTYTTISS